MAPKPPIQSAEAFHLDSALRTKTVRFHISMSFIYKILAVGLSYLLIPLTVNYLNAEQYGIWMTLLSIMSWVSFFDIGLGNGLRNKLAEALSANDIKLAKIYVSTAYCAVTIISLVFLVILLSVLPLTNWTKIFNTSSLSSIELSRVVFVVGFSFLLNFVLSLGSHIFFAYQEASLATMRSVLLNLFALIAIYVLIKHTSDSLLYLALCYGLAMVLSNVLLTYYLFRKHSAVVPSIRNIDLGKTREIASLGVRFFVIQIAVLIIFATDNLIITQLLGPDQVTPYNVLFKLFSIVTVGHGVIVATLWSAYTDAYAKGDIKWIKKTLKKLNILMIPIIIGVSIMVVFSREIINIWIGPNIKFPYLLAVLMGLYVIIAVWNNIYAYFVNGIGKINPQMYSAICGGLINIPLSIYFAKYLDMGISGVILGSIISISLFAVVIPIQTYFILRIDKTS